MPHPAIDILNIEQNKNAVSGQGQLTKGNSNAISSASGATAAPLLQAGRVAVDAIVAVLVLARRECVGAGLSGDNPGSAGRGSRYNGSGGGHGGEEGGSDDGSELHVGPRKCVRGALWLWELWKLEVEAEGWRLKR